MESKIFLGGGGNSEQSKDLDRSLAQNLTSAVEHPSCLYIPHAMEGPKHRCALEWFIKSYSATFDSITLAGALGSEELQNKTYDVIYLGGGNTGRLLDQIRDAGFDLYISSHLRRGGAVYGGSAGAIILGKSILTTPLFEHSLLNNKGLDLLDGRSVIAHYHDDTGREQALEFSKSLNSEIIAIPEDAGIIISGSSELSAVGKTEALLINQTGTVAII